MYKTLLISVFITSILIEGSLGSMPPEWQNHTISTLRLLQIVHRHGERAALKDSLPVTDHFTNVQTYWPEGFGQLTNDGKYRMYKMGQYLRASYDSYLGNKYSPREVYARSSIESRCIESVSCLLAGAYPPSHEDWQWNHNSDDKSDLGKLWQPFPIQTFMPKDDDTLLVPHKKCKKATEEYQSITGSDLVQNILNNYHKENISQVLVQLFNESITSLYRGQQFWDTLKIEAERDLIWPALNASSSQFIGITQSEVIDRLLEFSVGSYVHDWDRDFIRRIRIGNLIQALITNMKSRIDGVNSDTKLYVYSTHDTIVCPLLQLLKLYDNQIPAYGAAVLFELHQRDPNRSDSFFVKIYYYNETLEKEPYFLSEIEFLNFESENQKWFYTDFDKECNNSVDTAGDDNDLVSEMTFMVIGIAIGIVLLGLNLLAFKFIRARKERTSFRISR